MSACAAMPGSLTEYMIDVHNQKLLGRTPNDDRPLSDCIAHSCYAYFGDDVAKIKKYIAELELRLKKCEK